MLLQAWRGGDPQALQRLVPLVRSEIHRLASRYMKREPRHSSLSTAFMNPERWQEIDKLLEQALEREQCSADLAVEVRGFEC